MEGAPRDAAALRARPLVRSDSSQRDAHEESSAGALDASSATGVTDGHDTSSTMGEMGESHDAHDTHTRSDSVDDVAEMHDLDDEMLPVAPVPVAAPSVRPYSPSFALLRKLSTTKEEEDEGVASPTSPPPITNVANGAIGFTVRPATPPAVSREKMPSDMSSSTPAGPAMASTPLPATLSPQLNASAADTSQMPSLDLDSELFDWAGDLPEAEFMENNAYKPVYSIVDRLHMEFLFLHGILICLDSLIYYVSFLFVKFFVALWTVVRAQLLRRPNVTVYPRHVLVLMEASIVCVAVLLLCCFEYRGLYVFIKTNLSWAKLYVLFQLFGVLDEMMEQLSKRMLGGVVYSVKSGRERLAAVVMGGLVISAHSFILSVQMSALHVAFDSKSELLSLLLAVKLGELRSGRVASVSTEKLFETCVADTVERFKWVVFVSMMFLEKISDDADGLGEWLPRFTRSLVTVFLMEMAVDWIKHTCLSSVNESRIRETYLSFRTRLTTPFCEAPKLGFGSARIKGMQHFDFVTLPTTCVFFRLGLDCFGQLAFGPDGSLFNALFAVVAVFFALCFAKVAVRHFLRLQGRRLSARQSGKSVLLRHNSTSIPAILMEAVRQSNTPDGMRRRPRPANGAAK